MDVFLANEVSLIHWPGKQPELGGGFNPSERYDRQTGSFPNGRGENKPYLKPPPSWNMLKNS